MSSAYQDDRNDKGFFGHPVGLGVLAGLEVWDRISFYGMQSLLVLYMVGQLLLPGHVERISGFHGFRAAIEHVVGPLSTQALASQIFGLYVGLVALTPLIGGFLGDRLLGRRVSIIIGALSMAAGHLAMAFDQTFLLALLLLIVGAGFVRGNVAPQIGELYSVEDRRREVAFQIYGSVINFGAFVAPLATGALGQAYGWHIGFGFAAVGMMVGLIVYLLGQRKLPNERSVAVQKPSDPLTLPDYRRLGVLFAIVPGAALFWVAQSQIWNTYNIWVRDHLQLKVAGWTLPIPWLQSLDGLAPFLLLPPVLMLWRHQAHHRKEPNEFSKIAIGCLIFGAATLLLAGGQFWLDGEGRTPLVVAIAFHFASNLGWLFTVPTLNSLFSRLAPGSINATMLGVNALTTTLGSFISGRIGGFYEDMAPFTFWGLHAALVAGGGVSIWLIGQVYIRSSPALAAD
ncbi:MAG: MFS transporter [Phenylobacterium zucineum]|nr:MAG: MFS transporter [Phenylobacterium zucineum]